MIGRSSSLRLEPPTRRPAGGYLRSISRMSNSMGDGRRGGPHRSIPTLVEWSWHLPPRSVVTIGQAWDCPCFLKSKAAEPDRQEDRRTLFPRLDATGLASILT